MRSARRISLHIGLDAAAFTNKPGGNCGIRWAVGLVATGSDLSLDPISHASEYVPPTNIRAVSMWT